MLGLFMEIDPKLWSDPTHFNPERFENESEVNKLLPFGLGRMTYPEANLAQRTIPRQLETVNNIHSSAKVTDVVPKLTVKPPGKHHDEL
ncbi:Cytochrome P450 81E8 [Glycine soja]|uniref:Cytochrome P450 81E8 n=1 Tax=Glycine soja TaxID=3848 RepID=A0A445GIT4_GLYSO|nr:Cytochrome P450 81E8 [Glycine soja]